jgi:UDP-glucuronate 4-epimerase
LKAATYADVSALQAWTGVAPHTDLATGIERFVAWYRAYHA